MWTRTWPTEPGWYWFYGWCWKLLAGESEMHLVKVRTDGSEKPFHVTNGHFLWKGEGADGWWQKAILPDPPEEVKA